MDFSVIFIPETPKFIKIQLKISTIPQNHARFMQNFTSWRENVFLLRKSWFLGGGVFSPPPGTQASKNLPVSIGLKYFDPCVVVELKYFWFWSNIYLQLKNSAIWKKYTFIFSLHFTVKNIIQETTCVKHANKSILAYINVVIVIIWWILLIQDPMKA